MKLMRFVGQGDLIDCRRIEYGFEYQLLELAAALVCKFDDKKELRTLADQFDRLPVSNPLSHSLIHGEKRMYGAWLGGNQGMIAVEVIVSGAPFPADQREQKRREIGLNREIMPKIIESVLRMFDKASEIAILPIERCKVAEAEILRQLKAEAEKEADSRIVAQVCRDLFPSVSNLRQAEAQTVARRAMFRTGLEILINGNDEIQRSRDPFGNGPFEYRKIPEGFELISRLPTANGNSCSLRFSIPEADKLLR